MTLNSGSISESTFTTTLSAPSSSILVTDVISGSGGLKATGSGGASDVVLLGNNNFTGAVSVNSSTLAASNSNALGSSSNTATVASGAALDLEGSITIAQALNLSGTGIGGSGALVNGELVGGTNNIVTGPITLLANATIASDSADLLFNSINEQTFTTTLYAPASALEIGGNSISGSGGLNVTGNGGTSNVTLGADSFSGPVSITAATLYAQNSSALGNTSNTVTVASGAALGLEGTGGGILIAQTLNLAGTGIGGTGALSSIFGNNTLSGPIALTANSTIDNTTSGTTLTLTGGIVESTFTPTFTGVGDISESGAITGSGGLSKGASTSDTGTLSLSSGSNNFTGAVAINDGIVNVQSNNALGSSSNTVTVASGAALDLQGGISIAQPLSLAGTGVGGTGALVNVSGNNTISNVISLAANSTIANTASATALILSGGVSEGSNTPTFAGSGNIAVSAAITGSGGLSIAMSGATLLSATNNYTGSTTIFGGTLTLTGTLTASPVVVNAGLFGGTGNAASSVTVNSGATLSAGGSATTSPNGSVGTLKVGSLTMNAGSTLQEDLGSSGAADQIISSGSVTLDPTLSGTILGSTTDPSNSYDIIQVPASSLTVVSAFNSPVTFDNSQNGGISGVFGVAYTGGVSGDDVILNTQSTTSPVTQLAITTQPPSTVTAGSDFGFTVTAEDAQGNVATGFNGSETVALASNPGGSTLGGALTISATSGVASFSGVTLNKVGSGYTLAVTSGTLTSATSSSISVTSGTATQLLITTQPASTVTAGSGFGFTVTAEDAEGNVATGFTGSETVALASNPGSSTLGGTLTVSAASGIATFSGLTLNKVGSEYTLAVTSGTLTSATSGAISVTPGTATQLLITTQPASTVTAGVGFGFTVTAEDAEGNVATGFTGSETVALANNPGSSTLGGTLTVSATSGVA